MGNLEHHFVLAAEKEKEYYYKLLYPMQDKILSALFPKYRDKLYLTGGTALSRFYFQHRLSDDLDLFSKDLDFERAYRDVVNTI
ncbi:nucleotidyl transferase AbiEii/AbiGii toxin family protein [Thermovibrio sp.]